MNTASATPTGTDLVNACGAAVRALDGTQLSANESEQALWCGAYMSGLVDGFGVSPPGVNGRQVLCLPEQGIDNGQAIRIVTKWLREHPEHLHESGRMEAMIALTKAFPCP